MQNNTSKVDSLVQRNWQTKIDSLRGLGNFEKLKDSLKVIGWADSLRNNVNSTFVKKENALRTKVDSLILLNQPTTKFQQKLDSLQSKQQALLNEISAKQNQLQQKVNARYQTWSSKLDSLGIKMPNTDLSSVTNKLNIPNTKLPTLPNTSLPNLPNAQLPSTNLPSNGLPNMPTAQLLNVPSLNSSDFSGLNLSKDLKDVGGKFGIPNADQFKKWEGELKDISNPLSDIKGKMGEAKDVLKDPSKAAEDAAKQLKEVNSLTKEMDNVEKLKSENEALKTAEMMKDPEKLKEEATKIAIDHFAGKEQTLKETMRQLVDIKQKVPSLESLDKLPKNYKWPKNGLKGKPFRERVLFGMNFGIQNKKDTLIVDLFPNISYNLTGRVELGVGGIYRLRENTKNWQLDQENPVWGFNMFGTFKIFNSVRLRIESDAASYPKTKGFGEPIIRQWRWAWLAGVQTSFKLSKAFTGNIQMLYNFDRSVTAGFPEHLVLRFGVQYKLKEKPLQEKK